MKNLIFETAIAEFRLLFQAFQPSAVRDFRHAKAKFFGLLVLTLVAAYPSQSSAQVIDSDFLLDCEAGVAGNSLTTALLNAATRTGSNLPSGSWSVKGSQMKVNSQERRTLGSFRVGDQVYADQGGTRGFECDNAGNNGQYAEYDFEPDYGGNISVGFWMNVPNHSGSNPTVDALWFESTRGWAVAQYWDYEHPGGDPVMIMHCGNSSFNTRNGNEIRFKYETWYWITFEANIGGSCSLKMYEEDGSLIGTSTVSPGIGGQWDWMRFGRTDTHGGYADKGPLMFDDIVMDFTDQTFPLGPGNPDPDDGIPPSSPAGVVASAGDSQISLDWVDNGESDLASYSVYRSATSGSGYGLLGSGLGASSYVDGTTENGTKYYYVVTAMDSGDNESEYSSQVSATPQISAPTEASQLSAGSTTDTEIRLSWSDNSNNELGFHIERSATPGSGFVQIASVGAGVENYVDTGLAPQTTYHYRVRAYNSLLGSYSNEATATTAAPQPVHPINVDVVAATGGDLSGGWTIQGGGIFQQADTKDPAQGERATYKFNVTSAGDYKLVCQVEAPDSGSDSFFVSILDIDGEPTTDHIWAIIPVTSGGLEWRDVSWWGNGPPAEFDPKTWSLGVGEHTVVIRGREPNAKIHAVRLESVGGPQPPAAPKGLRIVNQ